MKKILSIILTSTLFFSGCNPDFLETKSTQSIDEGLVFMDTKSAILAVNGLHNLMWNQILSGTAPLGGFQMLLIWMEVSPQRVRRRSGQSLRFAWRLGGSSVRCLVAKCLASVTKTNNSSQPWAKTIEIAKNYMYSM